MRVLRARRMRARYGPNGFDSDYRQDTSPERRAALLERDALLLRSRILVDPSASRMAREILRTRREKDGWTCEGLRGVWNPQGGPNGTTTWWAADYATHSDGCRLLGLPNGPSREIRDLHVWEVEVNIDEDGSMYLCWHPSREDVANAIIAQIGSDGMVDGCLARNGRILALRGDGIAFLLPEDMAEDPKAIRDRQRREKPEAFAALKADLVRLADPHALRNGLTPHDDVLAAARTLVRRLSETIDVTAPLMTVSEQGEIAFEWRRPGCFATIQLRIDGKVVGRVVYRNRAQFAIDEPWRDEMDLDGFLKPLAWFRSDWRGGPLISLVFER